MERISAQQKKLLVSLVEEHFQCVNGRFQSAQGAQFTYSVWEHIHERLIAIEPAKTIAEWKKWWKNLRLGVKAKATKLRQYRTATGGGGPSSIQFTEQDEKIIAMVGIEAFDGAPDVPEGGLNIVTTPLQSPSLINSTISFGPEDFEETISPNVPSNPTNVIAICQSISTSPVISTCTTTEIVEFTSNPTISSSAGPTRTSTPIRRALPFHRPTSLIPTTSAPSPSTSSSYVPQSGPRNLNRAGPRRAPYLETAVDKSMEHQTITIELLQNILKALGKNNILLEKIEKGINK